MKKNIGGGFIRNKSRWKNKEQSTFLYRLGELLEAGYHLAEALRFLQSQESNKRKESIEKTIEMLKEGNTLYEVLTFLKFQPQLLQFVYYAEFYGDLPHALMEGGQYWNKRNNDREQLVKILMYPLLLLLLIMAIATLLQGMLLPKFQSLYESMNLEPSIFLQIIVVTSSISTYIPYGVLTTILILYLIKKYWFDKKCPLQRKKYLLQTPIVGPYIRIFDTYYLTYQLSGLIAGGLSINDSMQLFSKHCHQPFFQKLADVITRELNEGKSLESIFAELTYFERYMSDVIANGQRNGKLDIELYHYSRILLQSIEYKISSLMKIVQPLLFATVGFIVIAIYMSVLLPMFSIIEGL